jgi:DNA-binding NarL/FixJ family response regulator
MSEPVRVIIESNTALLREGIRVILQKYQKFKVDGCVVRAELLDSVSEIRPHIVLTTVAVASDVELTRQIKATSPQTRIVVLSGSEDQRLFTAIVEAGASGYLLTGACKRQLFQALDTVVKGGYYFCEQTHMMLSELIVNYERAVHSVPQFSEKELEIIRHICEEKCSKQIALLTNLTKRTVEKYRDLIMVKMGVKNVAGLVVYAIQKGIYLEKDR